MESLDVREYSFKDDAYFKALFVEINIVYFGAPSKDSVFQLKMGNDSKQIQVVRHY